MKKIILKKLLHILDNIEHEAITMEEAKQQIQKELIEEGYSIFMEEIHQAFLLLNEYHCIRNWKLGIDLACVPTIFAKSMPNSKEEALASFEMFLKDPKTMQAYEKYLHDHIFKSLNSKIDPRIFDVQFQTSLFKNNQIQKEYIQDCLTIIQEYKTYPNLLISPTLLSYFTKMLIPHNPNHDYRNMGNPCVSYPYLKTIKNIISRKGIPSNRDVTKSLQSFYKDCLFHEFDHSCPICGIHIPHMLIASHIKPFRDCGHIYETIDHNNGLLLCRNHDYLFDQGYFSFDDDGHILISEQLLQHDPIDGFHISKDFILPKIYMSDERKLFFQYHRTNIFLDHDL